MWQYSHPWWQLPQEEAVHYIPEQKRMRFENVETTSCPKTAPTPAAESEATTMMDKFLSCSPAVSSVLGAFTLRQWLHFQLISWAWKEAIDTQIALQLQPIGSILGQNSRKCNDVLPFFARAAPRLHCISFHSTRNATTMENLEAIGYFKVLKALDLTGLPDRAVYGILENLVHAKYIDHLVLPVNSESLLGNAQKRINASIPRLKPCFQKLFALKFLDLGDFDELHPLLLDLPVPENLKELKVFGFTNHCQKFILRCRNLEKLTLCSLPGGTVQRAVMKSLAQMEKLKSVAVDFGESSPSTGILQAVARLPKLRSLEVLGQFHGAWSIPWTQLQLLTHFAVEMETCADIVNQLSSLISLHLRLRTTCNPRFTCALSKLQSLSVKVEHGAAGYCTLEQPPFVLANLKSLSLRSFLIERIRGVSDDFLPIAPNIQELAIDCMFIFPCPDDEEEDLEDEEEEGKENHREVDGQQEEEEGELEEEEEEHQESKEEKDLEGATQETLEEIAAGCPNLETLTLPLEELEDQEYWLAEDVVERLVPELVEIFVAVCPKLNTIKACRKNCRFFGLAQRTFPQLNFFFQDDHDLNCQICNKTKNSNNK